jgi:diguanylate cyclase (GGDEF)-like protein
MDRIGSEKMEKQEKILIIDDSPVQASQLKSILEEDYEITLAHTSELGLRYAENGSYALVLLDVVMPGMDGFVLLKKLQEEVITRHTPVILITSLNDVVNEERGLTLGAVDYITKPYHPPIVRARVNTHIKLYRYRQQVEQKAMVDAMTGVANRLSYDTCYHNKWQDAARFRVPISLCMMDIDKFKVYNDTFGHPAGDKVIQAVAKTATSFLRRSTDFFARYGGEEFVAIILGNETEAAFNQMKKLRQAVEELHIPHSPEVSEWVTVSIGGVTIVPRMEDSYENYLKIADTMLYDAKRFGRNRVVWSTEKMEQLREK